MQLRLLPLLGRLAVSAALAVAASPIHAEQAPQSQIPPNPPARGGEIPQQSENRKPQPANTQERWDLFWQATSIGQYHGMFHSPYEGPYSLRDAPERDVSLTSTLFVGFRLLQNTRIYANAELAGGRGFSNVAGIADFPNGEMPRVATATPKPYLARAYIEQDFGFGSATESFEDEENQLAGTRPVVRYTLTVGRFSAEDFFDNNRYSHDPRTQFMSWATMYNGAFDYPADTRGYTWGWVHEFHTEKWSFRYGGFGEPKVANGSRFDRRVLRDRGDVWEIERRHGSPDRPGNVRLLGAALHTDSGTYSDAIKLGEATHATPDITAVRRAGTTKYVIGINAEQAITKDIGIFARLGWNDGKTQSFAFTVMDRVASGGISSTGRRWRRPDDTAGSALTVGGLSSVHARYLAMGGLDFNLGDGRLRYGPEYVWESYYSVRVLPGIFATFDLQRVANPAYNQDRGPVWVESVRVHMEFGRKEFAPKTN
jgi:high affinity Mn2+ porin